MAENPTAAAAAATKPRRSLPSRFILFDASLSLLIHNTCLSRPVYNKNMTLVVSVDHWSFPSGHSSRVFFIAFFVYFSEISAEVSTAVVAVLLWAAATSILRVLLGRHFVLDVVAGACLGVFEAAFVHRFLKF